MKGPAKLSLAQRLALLPVRAYRRFLSPLKASPSCRFHPTCSKYAVDAITQHGVLKGSVLALRRVLKCHPFHPGGFDPVPSVRTQRDASRHETLRETFTQKVTRQGRALTWRNFER